MLLSTVTLQRKNFENACLGSKLEDFFPFSSVYCSKASKLLHAYERQIKITVV